MTQAQGEEVRGPGAGLEDIEDPLGHHGVPLFAELLIEPGPHLVHGLLFLLRQLHPFQEVLECINPEPTAEIVSHESLLLGREVGGGLVPDAGLQGGEGVVEDGDGEGVRQGVEGPALLVLCLQGPDCLVEFPGQLGQEDVQDGRGDSGYFTGLQLVQDQAAAGESIEQLTITDRLTLEIEMLLTTTNIIDSKIDSFLTQSGFFLCQSSVKVE